ncbi:hypothetical protein MSUIS_05350 [Mycoplasma suis KI3806]|uniref:Uncharacterized protein n=1 Tax=Mycoplasma suis (strain KI_3806) TaxID=708248 RepID=F0V1U7_MYCS3|nr:hypothetical protein [Mycoplasma suis]CBZ40628.1 hypothetical protein MSUIS_05350 [Mycoplasma suis KI3806]
MWGYVVTDESTNNNNDSKDKLTCGFLLENRSTKEIKTVVDCSPQWVEEVASSRKDKEKGLWERWDQNYLEQIKDNEEKQKEISELMLKIKEKLEQQQIQEAE